VGWEFHSDYKYYSDYELVSIAGSQAKERSMTRRNVEQIVKAVTTREGGGFTVHRPFPTHGMDQFDPFLLLDEMGPTEHRPGDAKGAPDHPHRGFETVTYLLSGEMEHRDSHGNAGKLRAGGVQWMTAGAGVIHSEMPSEAFQKSGGTMHGFQIWVNLPKTEKLRTPRYQDIEPEALQFVDLAEGARVKLIAGSLGEVKGHADTFVPVTIAHLQLEPGSRVTLPVDANQRAAAYVFRGSLGGDLSAARSSFVIFANEESAAGGTVSDIVLEAGPEGADVLLLAGRPLREPVARYGPFVMNNRAEILQAVEDYEQGRFGSIKPELSVV
jgi:quercetin 2,3-dioxygenase